MKPVQVDGKDTVKREKAAMASHQEVTEGIARTQEAHGQTLPSHLKAQGQ